MALLSECVPGRRGRFKMLGIERQVAVVGPHTDGSGFVLVENIDPKFPDWGWRRPSHDPNFRGWKSQGQDRYWNLDPDDVARMLTLDPEEARPLSEGVRWMLRTDIVPGERYSFFSTEEEALAAIEKLVKKQDKGTVFELIEIASRRMMRARVTKKVTISEDKNASPDTPTVAEEVEAVEVPF